MRILFNNLLLPSKLKSIFNHSQRLPTNSLFKQNITISYEEMHFHHHNDHFTGTQHPLLHVLLKSIRFDVILQ